MELTESKCTYALFLRQKKTINNITDSLLTLKYMNASGSKGPLYSNLTIGTGTLALDGRAVIFGIAKTSLSGLASTILAVPPINRKKKKKKISHRQRGPLRGSSSPLWRFEPARVNPIKLAYDPCRPDASTFNRQCQYANSPGKWAYCYAELAISSLVVAETITSTHCAYPRRVVQAE